MPKKVPNTSFQKKTIRSFGVMVARVLIGRVTPIPLHILQTPVSLPSGPTYPSIYQMCHSGMSMRFSIELLVGNRLVLYFFSERRHNGILSEIFRCVIVLRGPTLFSKCLFSVFSLNLAQTFEASSLGVRCSGSM